MMSMSTRRTLSTKGEIIIELRALRAEMLKAAPVMKARDLGQALYDAFDLAWDLAQVLIVDALTALARVVVQEERARRSGRAKAYARAEERGRGTPEFPDFDAICGECPRNYAVPGEDDPTDTVYVETFDYDYTQLETGFEYLRAHAMAELRNAAALENLFKLCERLKGKSGETPREILARHSYDPGD
jgi:hypothetical protein